MSEVKFFKCPHCGNIIEKINDAGVPVMCCGQKMERLYPGTTEASAEKHIPVVRVTDNRVWVKVGAVDHPMTEEHLIEWVCLLTDKGVYRKHLTAGKMPTATFLTVNEKPIAVYAYCNLHGLWMASAEVAPVVEPVEEPKTTSENYTVCFCNQVSYLDIEKAIHENTQLADVLAVFEKVKDSTHCSTGCGGCHQKVMEIISDILMGN
ncbi:MAG: (2Fe-2S)-binding protein [Clostridia bacterium]|nr:(2Fe-2S)-binding protein [Clostridia bacterium]